MRKLTISIALTTLLFACKKTELPDKNSQLQEEAQTKQPSTPPVNANPAIAYFRYHAVSNKVTVPALYVMDANGGNQTVVYTNYVKQKGITTAHTPDFPAWSEDGQKLCFVLDSRDLYTLNISLVNGVPTGSNPVKIADGVAGGGYYGKGVWRPGTGNIAAVWQHDPDPTSIQLVSSTGSTSTTIYTSPSDFTIHHRNAAYTEAFVTFNSDGSLLAFFERQISTGNNFLKVLDMVTNTIVRNINLGQLWAIPSIDWANTSGSSIIGYSVRPDPCGGATSFHKIYSIDINAETPTPILIKNDADDISWSPDDNQIVYSGFSAAISNLSNSCNIRYYEGNVWILNVATNAIVNNGLPQGYNPDWKK